MGERPSVRAARRSGLPIDPMGGPYGRRAGSRCRLGPCRARAALEGGLPCPSHRAHRTCL
nr:MAG TPA: hypothetical protein [Caudoviricetes sp.]